MQQQLRHEICTTTVEEGRSFWPSRIRSQPRQEWGDLITTDNLLTPRKWEYNIAKTCIRAMMRQVP